MSVQNAALQTQVVKLERNVRRLTLVCIGLPFLALFLGADAAESVSNGKVISAEEFVLTSSDGEVRARLSTQGGNAKLVMYDKNKKPRVLIGVTGREGDPQVRLLSPAGITQLIGEIDRESHVGSLSFYHEKGQLMGEVGGSNLQGN